MTRRVFGAAALVAAVLGLTAQDAAAFGRKRKADCGTTGGAAVAACGTDCGAAGAVSYVDQVVTTYKPEWKTKKVDVDTVEYKWVDESYKYKVCEYVIKKDKAKVCELVRSEEKVKYTVHEWKQVTEKVKVCEPEWKEKKEDYTYYEPKYTTAKVKRTVYETVCVPTEVTVPVVAHAAPAPAPKRKGLFARLCKKKDDCADPCPPAPACPAPCGDACGAPCAPAVMTKVVMTPTRVAREVEVDQTTCTMVEMKGSRTVKYCEPKWVDKDVTVWKCVAVQKDGVKVVHTPTWVEKDVEVKVPTWVEKDGVRKVCKAFPVKKTVDHHYCELVKVQTTVKVPVYTPGPAAGCGTYPVGAGMGGGCCPAAPAAPACGGCP